jgi:ClpP class serine protease
MNSNEITSNDIIEQRLNDRLKDLGKYLDADLLTFVGFLMSGTDDQVRYAIEGIKKKREKLVIILETLGGYIEVAERMASTFRHHYQLVEFIIPNYAFSAGTILVMSGDAIYMDYYSVLGPIDPQVARPDGKMIPALGYLIQYDRLIEKSRNGELTTAELHYLIERFDPGELYTHERAKELSISLLKEWLVKYKLGSGI